MNKRYIGIDIEHSYLSAVQISYTDQQLCIERVASEQISEFENSIPYTLKALLDKHDFAQRAPISVNLPSDSVFFRSTKTELFDNEHDNPIGQSSLEHSFPIQPDNIIAQVCPHSHTENGETTMLVTAAKRDSLYDVLNILKTAKLNPVRVEANIFAVHATAMLNHPESQVGRVMIAYISESHLTLAVAQDNCILMVRNIPFVFCSDNSNTERLQQDAIAMLSEADITWHKVFGEKINENTGIYLAIGNADYADIRNAIKQAASCNIIAVDPYAKLKDFPEYNGKADVSVAEGLALGLSLPEKATGINFLEVEESITRPTFNLKKEVITYAILLTTIAAISIGGLFLKLSRLESKHTLIKNEIEEVFKHTLPQEKNIVNPLVQLDQKLQSLERSHILLSAESAGSLNPLKIFHTISNSIPSQATINSILINAESVRLTGDCNSFESVYSWQRSLAENQSFTNIDLQNVKKNPQSQKVNFAMSMSLVIGGAR